MELGPLITLAVIYGIMSVIGKISEAAGKGGEGKPGKGKRQPRPPVRQIPGTTAGRPQSRPTSFEDLLAEMRAQIEQAAGVEPPPISDSQDPDDTVVVTRRFPEEQEYEEIEDLRSSEIERIPVSIETVPEREPIRIISLDEQSELVAEARRRAAAERNRAWQMSDHREFHQRIDPVEKAVADGTAVRRRAELRRAMIWREVLDKPVALRDG